MTHRPPTPSTKAESIVRQRKPWLAPKVAKIEAGQAELGTRASSDGAFSTS